MNNAPIREPAGTAWSQGWTAWFQSIVLALGGWRKTMTASVTLDFGATGAQSETSLTATVTGARQGDAVTVSPLVNTAGIFYTGTVTANNTVTVYAKNFTAGSINPASTSFRIIVFQN